MTYLMQREASKIYLQHAPTNAPKYTSPRRLLGQMVDNGYGEMGLDGSYRVTRDNVIAYAQAFVTPEVIVIKHETREDFQLKKMISPEYKKYLEKACAISK